MEELKEIFTKAIQAYFDGFEPEEYNKVAGERKYNKKYFDSLTETDPEEDED